jgi:enoyl-CoA hydratase/carnithine racemase
MRGAHEQSREAQMAEESSTIAGLIGGADAREGIDAFFEKRQPVFG